MPLRQTQGLDRGTTHEAQGDVALDPPARSFGCPVGERGLHLRDMCVDCGGRPTSGQVRLEPRTILCLEGEPAEAVFAVIRGYLRESTQVAEGRTAGLRLIGPGDVIGADALLGGVHHCTVESVTSATVCAVARWQIEESLRAHPERARALTGELCGQIVQLRENVRRLASMSAEDQVRSFLLEILSDRPRGSWARLPLTRGEIAEHLGLALATVSRNVQSLARKGEIEVKGRHIRVPPR